MFNLFISGLWGLITIGTLIHREPVSWWLYAIATAIITFEYLGNFFMEDSNG